jgi:hypothetical protein
MNYQLTAYEDSRQIWNDVKKIIDESYDAASGGMKFALTDAG